MATSLTDTVLTWDMIGAKMNEVASKPGQPEVYKKHDEQIPN
jgi:hypothetical protein